MAQRRARRANNAWSDGSRDTTLNGMFEAMRDSAQHSLGGEISIGSQAEADLVGLPLPALCLRYLFQSTVLPLSRIFQITGEEGSAKSAFLYEIMRWHAIFGGGTILGENENKDSPELRHSIMTWNDSWINRILVRHTHSLEEWQDLFTTMVDLARAEQDREGGSGRTVPLCFAVDSLMATAPQSEIDAVRESGHASRGFALAANLIARYMRTMPERLKNYPFTMVATNHLKPATTPTGLPTSNIPGGKAVKFMETYEIEMKKDMSPDIDRTDYGGLRLVFIARKNSLGPSRKVIKAELLWWYTDADDGVWRQRTAWDWNTATIDLLIGFENAKGKKGVYNKLMEITGIVVTSKPLRQGYSEILGIPRSNPVDFRTIGHVLEQRPDLLDPIYKTLGIAVRRAFQPGMDYRAMLQVALEEAQQETQAQYDNNAVLLPNPEAEAAAADDEEPVIPEA